MNYSDIERRLVVESKGEIIGRRHADNICALLEAFARGSERLASRNNPSFVLSDFEQRRIKQLQADFIIDRARALAKP